ncbi:D-alanine--D-alanine ligase [Acidithiobacillus sp.]
MSEMLRVAVLYGGPSGEREVSLESGRNVLQALLHVGLDAVGIDVDARHIGEQLRASGAGMAFNVTHGSFGEDGVLQACLEAQGLPYTGSGVLAAALSMDKWRSKQLWRAEGLPVPEGMLLQRAAPLPDLCALLGLPFYIKPNRAGSSLGVSKIKAAGDIAAALAAAFAQDSEVICERAIVGREATVAVVDGQALAPIVIETPREFYDYTAKYLADDTRYLLPSGLGEQTDRQLQALALRAFAALDGRDWGRVDFMIDAAGRPFLLEMNSVPGMTSHSLVPMAAAAAGQDFDALCSTILRAAQRRVENG